MPDAFEIADANSGMPPSSTTYKVTSMQDSLSFTYFMAAGMFPASGTNYEWKVDDNVVASGPSGSCNISLAALGFTGATIPTSESDASSVTKTITCTVTNPDAETSSNSTSVYATLNINVWKFTIPDVSLNITYAPTTPTTNSSGDSVYKLLSLAGTFQMNAVLSDNSFNNAKYYWHIAKNGAGSLDITPNTTPASSSALSINLGDTALATALGITESDLSTNVNTPDLINVTCTVKHDDITDPTEWKNSQTTVRIYKKNIIGNKEEPDTIGDIVFSDGSAMSYTDFNALDSDTKNAKKSYAIAVIFYNGTACSNDGSNRILGVGLKGTYNIKWCESDANACEQRINSIKCTPSGSSISDGLSFSNDKDGRDNLEQIATELGANNDTRIASKYPAFYFAKNYSSTATNLGTTYADGWYLPALAELYWIVKNRSTINSALTACGGTSIQAKNHWSSSQCDLSGDINDKQAWSISINADYSYEDNQAKDHSYGGSNTDNYMYVRAIRQFN